MAKDKEEKVGMFIKIPVDLKKRVVDLARREDRKIADQVCRIIREFFDQEEK